MPANENCVEADGSKDSKEVVTESHYYISCERFIRLGLLTVAIMILSIMVVNREIAGDNLQKVQLVREISPETHTNVTEAQQIEEMLYLRNHFYVGDDWLGYRIGDMIKYHMSNWKNGTVDCVINRYFNKTDAKSDYVSLFESVQEIGLVNNYTSAPDNALVANLRLGDTHTSDDSSAKKYIKEKIRDILGLVRKRRLKCVYLVSGTHFPDHTHTGRKIDTVVNIERSIEIILAIRNAINVPVIIYVGRHPDEDFYFCATAKNFLPDSIGGYNKMCSLVNKLWRNGHQKNLGRQGVVRRG